MGLISEEAQARWAELLGIINDPANWPDFSAPTVRPGGTGAGGGGDVESERRNLLDALAAQIREWTESALGDAARQAQDLVNKYNDLVAAQIRFGMTMPGLEEAFNHAKETLQNKLLEPFERLGESDLQRQFRELNERFSDIAESFRIMGAGADAMARLDAARAAALADFWQKATESVRDLARELRGADPRVSSQRRFLDTQAEFRSLAARARAGDLDAIERLRDAAAAYRDQATSFLGGGVGSGRVLDEILSVLDAVGSLGSEANPLVERADQTNILLGEIRDVLTSGDRAASQMLAQASADSAAWGSSQGAGFYRSGPGERGEVPLRPRGYAEVGGEASAEAIRKYAASRENRDKEEREEQKRVRELLAMVVQAQNEQAKTNASVAEILAEIHREQKKPRGVALGSSN